MVQQCREHTEYIPTLLMCINETTMSVKIGNCENTQRNAIFKRGSVQHCCTSPQISRTLSWGILQTSIHGDLGVNAAILWWHNEVNVLRLCWYCYDQHIFVRFANIDFVRWKIYNMLAQESLRNLASVSEVCPKQCQKIPGSKPYFGPTLLLGTADPQGSLGNPRKPWILGYF